MGIPVWVTKLPWDDIREASEEHQVPWRLLGAIVQTESGGNTWATRYEPAFRYVSNARAYAQNNGITVETEEVHQKMSWGLAQVMGGTARDLGYQESLPMLCQPEVGLKYACLYIKRIVVKYQTQTDILAAYNAGSVIRTKGGMYVNEQYVDKVSKYLRELDQITL